MNFEIAAIIAALLGYGLGSIPFGLIFSSIAGLGDVRQIGSGNIGATNVLRTGNKTIAALTLLADILKGTFAVYAAKTIAPDYGIVAGFFAFIGHCFPFWLKFNGGKGVATYLGVLIAISWKTVLVFGAIWLTAAFVFRYSSVSSLTATAAMPGFFLWQGMGTTAIWFFFMSGLCWLFHRSNIIRLLRGEESRIGSKG